MVLEVTKILEDIRTWKSMRQYLFSQGNPSNNHESQGYWTKRWIRFRDLVVSTSIPITDDEVLLWVRNTNPLIRSWHQRPEKSNWEERGSHLGDGILIRLGSCFLGVERYGPNLEGGVLDLTPYNRRLESRCTFTTTGLGGPLLWFRNWPSTPSSL